MFLKNFSSYLPVGGVHLSSCSWDTKTLFDLCYFGTQSGTKSNSLACRSPILTLRGGVGEDRKREHCSEVSSTWIGLSDKDLDLFLSVSCRIEYTHSLYLPYKIPTVENRKMGRIWEKQLCPRVNLQHYVMDNINTSWLMMLNNL